MDSAKRFGRFLRGSLSRVWTPPRDEGLVRVSNADKARDCDIVFVHGLMGDAISTWQRSPNEFWPDWVDQDHPRAVVWTLGYAASPTAWRGRSMSIYERAKNALATLDMEGVGQRPLAFVCHSLGGLLVKRMLSVAAFVAEKEFPSFVASTRLVIFVATPHSGASIANTLNRFRDLTRPTDLLEQLRKGKSELTESNDWFKKYG